MKSKLFYDRRQVTGDRFLSLLLPQLSPTFDHQPSLHTLHCTKLLSCMSPLSFQKQFLLEVDHQSPPGGGNHNSPITKNSSLPPKKKSKNLWWSMTRSRGRGISQPWFYRSLQFNYEPSRMSVTVTHKIKIFFEGLSLCNTLVWCQDILQYSPRKSTFWDYLSFLLYIQMWLSPVTAYPICSPKQILGPNEILKEKSAFVIFK